MNTGIIRTQRTATIASTGDTSNAIDLSGAAVVTIGMPAALDGANLSFEGSHDGTTFAAIYDGGSLYSIAFTASVHVVVSAVMLAAFKFIKIVSDGTESANRAFTLGLVRGE